MYILGVNLSTNKKESYVLKKQIELFDFSNFTKVMFFFSILIHFVYLIFLFDIILTKYRKIMTVIYFITLLYVIFT